MTESDLLHLTALSKKDDAVKNLLDEYNSFKEDPAKVFYLQITEVVKALSKDMNIIINGSDNNERPTLITGDKDVKYFDQIKVLLLDTETIFKGLKFAREHIMPELKVDAKKQENEEGMSAVDRIANSKKK